MDGTTATEAESSAAFLEFFTKAEPAARSAAIHRRDRLKATFGNLTLVHYGVNRSLQHSSLVVKRERFFVESNLHLNRALMRAEAWNEDTIEQRGRELFELVRQIWKGPAR
jgi:hypothetical protein